VSVNTFKLIILIKRKASMSVQEFRDYYENIHSKLGEQGASQLGMCYYIRRYLDPVVGAEAEYDVITESWFTDRGKFEEVLSIVRADMLDPAICADEERFMDRSRKRICTVVERESSLPSDT
jgi:hypothetical protein